MIDSIVDLGASRLTPNLFLLVFADQPKWLRRPRRKLHSEPASETASRTREGRRPSSRSEYHWHEGPALDHPPRHNSNEGEGQKAGAEQGDPTGSQGKEAVGHKISISHDTPSDSHARPN